ncbi:hypothetical protein HMPREF0083_04093 [Aneurinibacillus aneurinilyticus ATCC 12856]|uniref:Uncharacterized protein n=1 Tax=Aneurinibacillus aneurinilyticus ATCC 12856 TaxID=649747 RepID=U1YAL9_ANEAE|nr:hypothetical protein HMPREF0083_04093 [Aneurinibacillus aneurinilyticus ATCC 12856]
MCFANDKRNKHANTKVNKIGFFPLKFRKKSFEEKIFSKDFFLLILNI